ncbi:nuclear transport factor 2 family protein [Bowmanella yangjiangensis]|uniref:nuclear transport factor 2 family protein n=1 Tax=Bowmanella yangjiangensis TaxID=2811230 RepID=UPI001E527C2B|nr:nuclear transport factor 2 family protein [Bowmanella yangjiangensis]
MKHRFFALITWLILLTYTQVAAARSDAELTAATEHAAIETAIQDYFHGSAYSDKARLKQAFHSQARLYLEKPDTPFWEVPATDYINWYKEANQGKFNGRLGRILHIDREGNLATVKAEILMPARQQRYIDMFLLKKLDGVWQILSKSAVGEASPHNGKRILFILSSAHFHGDSNLPTGVSFSEIVNAYDEFAKAGFSVDFVSPQGGALPLAYINTSDPMHKKYLYNSDFMYAIGHTLKPEQVVAQDYRAVHYVGGTNAMYGVADHPQLQKISMTIYEQHGGIISAVCHGTAGIAHLRLKNGEYLVTGRRISGYPDVYEHQDRPYFQEFPFLITKTIEERGGTFLYSPRNTPHIEIDGRIITGQNYLSSAGVAKAMIDILTKETAN